MRLKRLVIVLTPLSDAMDLIPSHEALSRSLDIQLF